MLVRSLLRVSTFGLATASLIAALVDCDSDKFAPIDTPFGQGGAKTDATVAGSSTSGGADNPYAGDGINDDPNFDPEADGGYWSGIYDAGDAATTEDGGPNGGPDLYKSYTHCPVVKVAAFQLDGNESEATVYGADFSPSAEGTVDRLNVLLASKVPFSFFGPFFPLGFIDPPGWLPGVPKVETFPFPSCKRCVFAPTGEPDTEFVAIGGMLAMSPAPDPRSGRISARLDLAVLVEAKKIGSSFIPVPSPRCIRVLTAPISVR